MLIHRTPGIMQHASDPDEHLIQMPCIPRPRPTAAQPFGKFGTELMAPAPDALVGNQHGTFGEDQLDIAQAEAEHMIQPHGVTDDLGWEAMAMIRTGLGRHPIGFG
jgi:hypothetical protein